MKVIGPERRKHILDEVSDVVGRFVYYDRKEDDELPRGSIEDAIKSGEITLDEIVEEFRKELAKGTK